MKQHLPASVKIILTFIPGFVLSQAAGAPGEWRLSNRQILGLAPASNWLGINSLQILRQKLTTPMHGQQHMLSIARRQDGGWDMAFSRLSKVRYVLFASLQGQGDGLVRIGRGAGCIYVPLPHK
jgi:hypothetical protein